MPTRCMCKARRQLGGTAAPRLGRSCWRRDKRHGQHACSAQKGVHESEAQPSVDVSGHLVCASADGLAAADERGAAAAAPPPRCLLRQAARAGALGAAEGRQWVERGALLAVPVRPSRQQHLFRPQVREADSEAEAVARCVGAVGQRSAAAGHTAHRRASRVHAPAFPRRRRSHVRQR